MGKPGRNDACPCGSGSKYKKCCLAKDEAAARTSPSAAVHRPSNTPAEQPSERTRPLAEDPELAEYERWLSQLDAAPLDEQLAMAHEVIGLDTFEEEQCFEVGSRLAVQLTIVGRGDEARALLARIEREHPEVAAVEAAYFAYWHAEVAVRGGYPDQLERFRTLGRHHGVTGLTELLADLLMFEGRGDLVEAWCASAVTAVVDAEDEGEPFDVRSVVLGVYATIARHRATNPALTWDEPALQADLRPYLAELPELVESARSWVARAPQPSSPEVASTTPFLGLIDHFGSLLQLRAGWPELRVALVREGFMRWVARRPSASSKKAKRAGAAHTLAVMPESLEAMLRRHSDGFSMCLHAIVAELLALPHWRGFLVEHGLVQAEAAEAAFRTFRGQMTDGILRRLCAALENEDAQEAADELRAVYVRG